MLKAVTRQASLVDAKIAGINSTASPKISTAYFFDHYATKEDVDVVVNEEDFLSAERELVPSVSFGELEHYGKVRAMFEKVGEEKKENGEANGGTNGRVNGKGKGKGKERVVDRKGKGKAVERWDDPVEEDEDDVNGYGVESRSKGKGKGKAIDMGEDDD